MNNIIDSNLMNIDNDDENELPPMKHDKLEMLKKYESQISLKRPYFEREYIYSLAKVRGIQCGAQYAESFEIIRWIL